MDTTRATAMESPGQSRLGPSAASPQPAPGTTPPPRKEPSIRVRKQFVPAGEDGKEIELYTMSLGHETIELVPLRNWGQLDVYKWRAQGRLPGTPAGLEITHDHVKLIGETVSIQDPEGCAKLEKLFADWLALENETLALARQKKARTATQQAAPSEPQVLRYVVERDKSGMVHIRCAQGKETLATIGLNAAGFQSLFTQGLMRKPRALHVGALHDWVELDGVLFSFEQGNDDTEKLTKALNEQYIPLVSVGQGKDVVVFANPASSTGFDIQFPVSVGGMTENKRRPLNEESLDLLQDPNKCGLLQKGLVIKVSRPNFIFKQKTPDGGERYLESTPDNLVVVTNEDGVEKTIDLSKPVNYLHLSTMELTAIFNHPAIHRHGKAAAKAQATAPAPVPASPPPPAIQAAVAAPPLAPAAPPVVAETATPEKVGPLAPASPGFGVPPKEPPVVAARSEPVQEPVETPVGPADEKAAEFPAAPSLEPATPRPNSWLKETLARQTLRHDWLACLTYSKVAGHFGNSSPGKLGLSECWSVRLAEATDPEAEAFKGFFLTRKGGFGFLNQGHIVRFNKGVAFLGKQETALEGIDVVLVAVGLDSAGEPVFIVKDGFRTKFGVAPQAVEKELQVLQEYGIHVLSVSEVLASSDPLQLVWFAPIEQESPTDPQAFEFTPPEPAAV